jgi:PAS domain S-box-containing protein
MVAPGVDETKQHEDLLIARRDAEALFQISQDIAFSENEKALVNAIARFKPAEADTISLIIYDNYDFDSADGMVIAADWGGDGSLVGTRIPKADFPFTRMITRDELALFGDVLNDLRVDSLSARSLTHFNVRAFASVPLVHEGRWIGALTYTSQNPYEFHERELRFLRSMGQQIAITLERFRLARESAKRALDLQTVSAVSSAISTILNLDELLPTVALKTRDAFGLYHAHIYLFDEAREQLVLTAGAGEAGRVMRGRGHRIAANHPHSLVATAARTGEGVIVNNVTLSPDFLPNPLLPETKSEMALPMIVNDEVIGVLDVQSDTLDRFSEDDRQVMTILAGQIAAAVENARAFEQSRRQLELQKANVVIAELVRSDLETETMVEQAIEVLVDLFGGDNGVMSRFNHQSQQWEGFAGAGTGMTTAQAKHFIDPASAYPHGFAVIQTGKVVAVDSAVEYPDFPKAYIEIIGIKSVLTLPIQGRGQVDGVVFINFNTTQHSFSRDEIEIAEVIASQLSVGIQRRTAEAEQKKLAQEAQRSALFLRSVIDATPDWIFAKDRELHYILANASFLAGHNITEAELIGQEDKVLGYTEELLGDFNVADRAALAGEYIHLEDELNVRADGTRTVFDTTKVPMRDQNGEIFAALGFARDVTKRYDAEEQIRLYASVVDNMGTGVYVYRLEDKADAASLRLVAANAAAAGFTGMPNDQIIGKRILEAFPMLAETQVPQIYQNVALNGEDVFLGEIPYQDENLQPGIYEVRAFPLPNLMMGVSFENITERKKNEAQLQQRATQLQTVAEVSRATATILDQEALLNSVGELTKSNFGLYHAHIYLLDGVHKQLVLTAGAGEAGRLMKARGHKIAADHPHSLVATAARSGKGVIVNNVTLSPDFLPNPLLPETKSEMALPMIVNDEVIGVLDVQSDKVDRFIEDDIQVMTVLAGQIAAAVENARAFEQNRRQLELQKANVAIAELVRSELETETMLERAIEVLVDLFGGDNGVMSRFNHETQQWEGYVGAGTGMTTGQAKQFIDPATAYPHGYEVIQKGKVVAVDRAVEYPDFPKEYIEIIGIKSVLTMPITGYGQVDGVIFINFNSHHHSFTHSEIEIAEVIASQLSVGIQRRTARAEQMRMADQAQRNALLFRSVIDATPDWIFAKDHNFRFILGNSSFVRDLGTTEQNLIGKDDHEYGFPDELIYGNPQKGIRGFRPDDEMVLSGTPVFNDNDIVVMADGEQHILDTHKIPLRDTDGEIYGLMAIARDITAQRRADEQLKQRATQLQTVAEVSRATTTILNQAELLKSVVELTKSNFGLYHAHIYLLDDRRKYLVLAAGAGEPGRKMVEKQHRIALDQQHSIVVRAARTRDAVIANNVAEVPYFLPNPLLPDTQSELAVPLLVGDRMIGVLDVQSDQANRFDETDALIQTTLAGQIAVAVENARAVESALSQERATAERLREVDRLKSQFLANMSHELRTPLNSIIGYSEVMIDGDDGELSSEALEDVTIIHNSGRHLLAIINDILDLAKIESGQIRMERKHVNLLDIINETVQTSQVLVKDKPVSLTVEALDTIPSVYGDDIRIRQILNNLVSNAAKFTDKGAITIRVGMSSPGIACVSVQDTGMGISQSDLTVIFEQFKQLDNSSTRRAGGTGLGLTITRRLVEMMDGDIRVESEVGVGTTFTFTLPVTVGEALPA